MLKLSRLPDGRAEVFASIQGEGVSAGIPSVFLRLSLCNLACTWCDTKYTWDWTNYDPQNEIVQVQEEEVVSLIKAAGPRNVVVTGGEPLLQQEPLGVVLGELKALGFRIEIETNGTLKPSEVMAESVDQWNVSPKLANSGNELVRRHLPAVLKWYVKRANAFFKFVIVDIADLNGVIQIVNRYRMLHERVLLMPEGVDDRTLRERGAWLARNCVRLGFRFGPRQHILLWGNRRGT